MDTYTITPLTESLTPRLVQRANLVFGESFLEIQDVQSKGASFCALCDGEIVGGRITYVPGTWLKGELKEKCAPELWPFPAESAAYFKSVFVDPKHRRHGLARRMSSASIEALIRMGAKGVVCHSWLESPGNSSVQYLKALGFKEIRKIPRHWANVDYLCSGCQTNPCQCTAIEMVKPL